MKWICLLAAGGGIALSLCAAEVSRSDRELAEYFRAGAAELADHCLTDLNSLADWASRRAEYRRELQEMLGLWPMPERSDLKAVVTGRLERDEFTVEKLQFQALPHLYVTANLYLPKNAARPAPAILYECGHWRLVTNGISYGNKAVYQADGAWYARNGYVCLVPDTVLAGEIQGIHTGTRDHGLWWWNSRGYTPAGVEAWIGIRALDYLCTRPEADTNRFGVTGHSGGGAYSWTVTALDDRIKAAAPLAGMADLQSHIGDAVLDSHCDCNFFVNYHRWDFPMVAALAAPRPLLIGGTDHDRLFRLPSTLRIYDKIRGVYQLHGATNQLGLVIAPGPHDETPELRLAVMRWFNRHLKGEETPVETAAKRMFAPTELKVFDRLPADAINPNIADTFVPPAAGGSKAPDQLRAALREKVFAGWPAVEPPLEPGRVIAIEREGVRFTAWDFTSQDRVRLRFYLLEDIAEGKPGKVALSVLDPSAWTNWIGRMRSLFGDVMVEELPGVRATPDSAALRQLKHRLAQEDCALAFFAPRGVGLGAWSGDARALTRIRRRFMLLGQTLDGMRVWDIRRAVQAVHYVRADDPGKIEVRADSYMGVDALYAALFESNVRSLALEYLPKSHTDGPDYLGVLKICDIPQVLQAVRERADVNVR